MDCGYYVYKLFGLWIEVKVYSALGATTISAIYKDRWQIELFFEALKQSLKVKTFVGNSENALNIQIWTPVAK